MEDNSMHKKARTTQVFQLIKDSIGSVTHIASDMKKGQNMNHDNNPPKDKRGAGGEEVAGCHEGSVFQL